MPASTLIRAARRRAGLTQTELAERAAMPQSSIARLEAPGSNPTVATLERVLAAADQIVRVAPQHETGVDETLIVRNLALTPAERLANFRRTYANVQRLRAKARRLSGDVG
jgi:transcriptional regulator with XRE-family HTH domain